jgi:hypothetical protein
MVHSANLTANRKLTISYVISPLHARDRRVWFWLAGIWRRASDSLRTYTLRLGCYSVLRVAYRLKTQFGGICRHVGEEIISKLLYKEPKLLYVYP